MRPSTKFFSLCIFAILQGCTSLPKPSTSQLVLTQAKSDAEVLKYVEAQQDFSKRLQQQQNKLYSRHSFSQIEEVAFLADAKSAPLAKSAAPDSEGNSITNNQEASVDEGGIVKRYGKYLLILKRGKIYVVETKDPLRKVGEFNVQQTEKHYDSWYDELLIYKNKVIVIGYSYALNGSEYQFFTIDADGQLEHDKTYLINSSDYFDQSNYASRLVDGKLVFILKNMPVKSDAKEDSDDDTNLVLPTVATLNKDNSLTDSRDLFSNHTIYNPLLGTYRPHMTSVVVCPLDEENFECSATSVFGGYSADHYVSRNAVYVWNSGNRHVLALPELVDDQITDMLKLGYLQEDELSVVYRIPLPQDNVQENSDVTAVALKGQPLDQFSFAEKEDNLLLVTRSYPLDKEHPYSDIHTPYPLETYALSIPLSEFSNTVPHIPEENYLRLDPQNYGSHWGMVNRFVGNYLLFSHASTNNIPQSLLTIADPLNFQIVDRLETEFNIAQIYPAGKNAVLLGNTIKENTYSSVTATLQLEYDAPIMIDAYSKTGSHLAESRSHSFFYRPYEAGGIAGFPVGRPMEGKSYKREGGKFFQREPIVDMNYLTLDEQLFIQPAGALEGDRTVKWSNPNKCTVSCTDWYGSARPIFIGDRIFALLKYELIEGYLSGGYVIEKQRINFGPSD